MREENKHIGKYMLYRLRYKPDCFKDDKGWLQFTRQAYASGADVLRDIRKNKDPSMTMQRMYEITQNESHNKFQVALDHT